MNRLRIPLINIPEEGLLLDERIPVRDIQPPDADTLPVDFALLKGTLTPISGDYLFQGTVSGSIAHPCDRCLVTAQLDFSVPVTWTFLVGGLLPEEMADDDETEVEFEGLESSGDVVAIAGDELDLSVSVWEELALAMPTKFVCDDNCKGLCPHCGVNLNDKTCTCEGGEAGAENGNPAFAKLKDLFPNLPN